MEDILRLYLTYFRHELIADFQLAFSHSKAPDGDARWVRWERFGKDPRQLGTGALAAAPSRGERGCEFEICHD
jgi:hypothetical protein